MLRPLFWHDEEQRIRAPWRFLIFFAIAAAVANPLVIALDATGHPLLESAFVNPLIAVGFFLAIWVIARYVDRRPLSDFGLWWSWRWWGEVGIGFLIGALIMTLLFLVQFGAGWVTIQDTFQTNIVGATFAAAFIGQMLRYLAGSFFEELMTRSFLFRLIAEPIGATKIGKRGAVFISWVITSILFGILHLANPNATLLGAINISMAGVFLGLGIVLTGSLALPIGIHMAWNVFQNNVYGLPNSGQSPNTTMLVTEVTGPTLWTGGAFGPEGGLLSLGAITLGCVLVWGWVRYREGPPVLQTSLADPPLREKAIA